MNWLKNTGGKVFDKAKQAAEQYGGPIGGRVGAKLEAWKEPEAGLFLHGTLHVRVHRARNLLNVDTGIMGDVTDAYVRLSVDGRKGPRTETVNNSLDPEWEEDLKFSVGSKVSVVTLTVKDQDIGTLSKDLGRYRSPFHVPACFPAPPRVWLLVACPSATAVPRPPLVLTRACPNTATLCYCALAP